MLSLLLLLSAWSVPEAFMLYILVTRFVYLTDLPDAPELGQEEGLEQEVPHLHRTGQAGWLHVEGSGRKVRSCGGEVVRTGWEGGANRQGREVWKLCVGGGTQTTNQWKSGSDNLFVRENRSGKGGVVPQISSGVSNEVRGESRQPVCHHLQEWWVVHSATAPGANSFPFYAL